MLTDSYGRQIKDLRISLTDRCNFRCFYCLPNGEPPLARKDTILTFEEIEQISEIFVSLGIEKIRLTGGERMLRRNIEDLIEKLSRLKVLNSEFQAPERLASQIANLKFQILNKENRETKIPNPKLLDLAITTNGFAIAERAETLKRNGLDRFTVSLDSLKERKFPKNYGR